MRYLLRDYIQNACEICGLTFKSSILNNAASPYYNLLYFNANAKAGHFDSDPVTYIDENKPLLTGTQLLDQLKPVFNAKWTVKNGCLYFERRDFIDNFGGVWLDTTAIDKDNILDFCLNGSEQLCAYFDGKYSQDGIDWVGDEALDRFNDIVEWNPNGVYKSLKGGCENLVNFGAARFRGDGIDRDIYANDFYTSVAYPWSQIVAQNEDVLIMNNGTAALPKLLVWDGVNKANAKIIHKPNPSDPTKKLFNYPMFFDEHEAQGLYPNFHEISHPLGTKVKRRSFSLKVKKTCDLQANLDTCKTVVVEVCGELHEGAIDDIQFSASSNSYTINGRI